MSELAIYDANVIINWRKIPKGKTAPRPLNKRGEYVALIEGSVRLVMSPRWFADARGGFRAAWKYDLAIPKGDSPRAFDFLLATLKANFADPAEPIERRILNDRIAFSVPEDPRDNHLAETAIAARVRYLVTSDHHLLALRFHPSFLEQAPNTLVVTPNQLADLLPMRDAREQNRYYLNKLVLPYLHARESGISPEGWKGELTKPSKLMGASLETLRRMVWTALKSHGAQEQSHDGAPEVQFRRRRRGGPEGGGEGGSGSLPPSSGPNTPPTQTPPRQGKGRMLSIAAVGAGGGPDYLAYLLKEYYSAEADLGVWMGTGSERLGLRGSVTKLQFGNHFDGFDQDGRPLVKNAGHERRQPGWDLTFSAPKAVSVLWAVLDQEQRARIEACHRQAVADSLRYLETAAGLTRTERAGKTVKACGLTVATFGHATSRELDPQLHTHCFVFNLGVTEDGKTRAIKSKPLMQHKMAAGAIYQASLAAALVRELGLTITPGRVGFKIEGVPSELSEHFSKRRQQIEAALGGNTTGKAEAAAEVAHETRRGKEQQATEKLFSSWAEVAKGFGFGREHGEKLIAPTKGAKRSQEKEQKAAADAVKQAVSSVMEHQSHFAEKDIVREAARLCRDGRCGGEAIRQAVEHELAGPNYARLGKDPERVRFTTQEMWKTEKELLHNARELAKTQTFAVPEKKTAKTMEKYFPVAGQTSDDERKRNTEQRKAAEHLVKPEALTALTGLAGTGKSTVLKACRETWEAAGYKVTGIALAGVAARNLQESSGIQSETLALRVKQIETTFADKVKHHATQVLREAVGLPTHQLNPFKLDSKTVVVLDEAGMVGTRQMGVLAEAVRKSGAKLVLVGDSNQLQPIEAGGPFQAITTRIGSAHLGHVIRQKLDKDDQRPDWMREAVKSFATGHVQEGLKPFAERGKVTVTETRDEARKALVADWLKADGLKKPEKSLILTSTNDDARAINAACQKERVKASGLKKILEGVHVNGEVILPGDRVFFTKKSRPLGVENGNLGTVLDVSGFPGFRKMTVELDGKRIVTVDVAKFDSFRLGYAVTTHKSQGATCERSFVLVGGPMQDRHLSYVQASRAKEEARFYTDKAEAGPELTQLVKSMSQDRTKDTAHDQAEKQSTHNAKKQEQDKTFTQGMATS